MLSGVAKASFVFSSVSLFGQSCPQISCANSFAFCSLISGEIVGAGANGLGEVLVTEGILVSKQTCFRSFVVCSNCGLLSTYSLA